VLSKTLNNGIIYYIQRGRKSMARIVHFDITAEDAERAIQFYEKVFGWKFTKWEGPMEYWLINTGPQDEPGIDGGLSKREGPDAQIVNTLEVKSIDSTLDEIVKAGGKILRPKGTIPGVGYFAQCTDTEGTLFGVMESDTNAK
jgi:predicted enzyme related to lactoylglutathione lyase